MKPAIVKPAATPLTPVFPQTLHRLRTNANAVARATGAKSKPQKRDNTFSKSRDTREDRAMRQIKTTHNSQTLFRACGHSKP
jgi:hypothetical protein